ncbi:unnamed protein product [Schistosoma rodhaini]|nr:unnamed protein product [Schistosoma rodhaini]
MEYGGYLKRFIQVNLVTCLHQVNANGTLNLSCPSFSQSRWVMFCSAMTDLPSCTPHIIGSTGAVELVNIHGCGELRQSVCTNGYYYGLVAGNGIQSGFIKCLIDFIPSTFARMHYQHVYAKAKQIYVSCCKDCFDIATYSLLFISQYGLGKSQCERQHIGMP